MQLNKSSIVPWSIAALSLVGMGISATQAASSTEVTTPAASAATTAVDTAVAAPALTPGTFKPNEDATHEAGESAAREAQENTGQVPTMK